MIGSLFRTISNQIHSFLDTLFPVKMSAEQTEGVLLIYFLTTSVNIQMPNAHTFSLI